MTTSFKHLLYLAFSLLLFVNTYAQKFPYKHYTVKDGLAGMQVTYINKDSRGFLWLCTKNGLSKFDGEKFENFNVVDGLENKAVFGGICEGPRGDIYFINGKSFFAYNGKKFRKVGLPPKLIDICSPPVFYKENIYLTLAARFDANFTQAFIFDGNNKYTKVHFPKTNGLDFIPRYFDKFTGTWFGTMYNPVTKIFTDLYEFKNGQCVLKAEGKTYYYVGRDAKYNPNWNIGLLDEKSQSEIFHIRENNGQFRPWIKITKLNQPIVIQPFDKDQLFTYAGIVYLIEKNTSTLKVITDEMGQVSEIVPGNTPGSYFIGTEKGLIYFANNGFKYFTEADAPYTWSVAEGPKGDFWFNGYGVPLKYYDGKTIKTETRHLGLFPFKNILGESVTVSSANFFYFGSETDKHGQTWFPNASCLIGFNGKTFFRANGHSSFHILYDEVHDMIIQSGAMGVNLVEAKKPFKDIFLKGGTDLLQFGNYMLSYKDKLGRYWLGGWGGMNLFKDYASLKAKKSTVYSQKTGNLPFKGFMSMYHDSLGTLWAGTSSGLFYFNEPTQTFIQAQKKTINSFISFIGNVGKDKLLIGDERGLFVMNVNKVKTEQEATIKFYNYNNGFLGQETGQNGLKVDSKGRIWITSGTILSYIEPEKLDLNTEPLQAYISKINNAKLSYKNQVVQIDNQNNLHATVGATGQNRSFKTEYAYKIDDGSWSKWQQSNEIFVSNLPNGDHTLFIKANTLGFTFEQLLTTSQPFNINVAFYKDPTFAKYALGILLACLAGIGTLFIRNKRQLRKIKENEALVNKLKIQTLQSQLNPHFLNNTLEAIKSLARNNQNDLLIGTVNNLAVLMRNYLEASVMDYRKIGQNRIALQKEIDLLKLYVDLEKLHLKYPLTFTIDYPEDLDTANIEIPPLLYQPFVENAIKHGIRHLPAAGLLEIKFFMENDYLVCHIKDNGIGRKKSNEINASSAYTYTSFGTSLVLERVELLKKVDFDIVLETIDYEQPTGTLINIKIKEKADL